MVCIYIPASGMPAALQLLSMWASRQPWLQLLHRDSRHQRWLWVYHPTNYSSMFFICHQGLVLLLIPARSAHIENTFSVLAIFTPCVPACVTVFSRRTVLDLWHRCKVGEDVFVVVGLMTELIWENIRLHIVHNQGIVIHIRFRGSRCKNDSKFSGEGGVGEGVWCLISMF